MISYSDYKLKINEADAPTPPTPDAGASAAPSSGMPDPSTGMPPSGMGGGMPPSIGDIGSPFIGGDMGGMGAPGASDPNQKPTALELKAVNFFDALHKLLKKIDKEENQ
jgi:hypothetical protein